jgi:hypothetical protein
MPRRAKDRSSADDYDARWKGRDVGRIFKPGAGFPTIALYRVAGGDGGITSSVSAGFRAMH